MMTNTTEPQTPTDQTPDAVRAAIAEALDDAFADTIDAYVENDETANAYLRGDLIRTVFTVLDQLGALRPVGEGVTISVEAVTHIGHFMRDARHFDPEFDQWVLDELDAAARAGGEEDDK